ncbi:MAG TPA: hypothetical protein VK878_22380 [Candidatus Deferrimicrobiaceae bacterium]|nr:hypothetical protein [Candidatus Deferrimicrobiaceae bacterium]
MVYDPLWDRVMIRHSAGRWMVLLALAGSVAGAALGLTGVGR